MFDPYYAWLGIPPAEQPPNHYRLLGVNLFEVSTDTIANAADRQMVFLRNIRKADEIEHAQKLLNEVAAARVCLLDEELKLQYDQQLREAVAFKLPPPKPMTEDQVRFERERAGVTPPVPTADVKPPPRRITPQQVQQEHARAQAVQFVEAGPAEEPPGPAPVYQQVVHVATPESQAIPALASFFIVGFGQLIQGRVVAAICWFFAAIVATLLVPMGIGLLALPFIWITCIVDAAQYQPGAASGTRAFCPMCGGRLTGNYAKCQYCRSDLVWEGGVPKTRQQAEQESLLRQQRYAELERHRQIEEQRREERLQRYRARMMRFVDALYQLPGQVDEVLQKVAGEGNDIVHGFLRVAVISCVVAFVVVLVAVLYSRVMPL